MPIRLQVDVGFGDRIVPEPQLSEFPALLAEHGPFIRLYSPETVIAEKFNAMALLGLRFMARSFRLQIPIRHSYHFYYFCTVGWVHFIKRDFLIDNPFKVIYISQKIVLTDPEYCISPEHYISIDCSCPPPSKKAYISLGKS